MNVEFYKEYCMIKTYKVKLLPNKKQATKFFQFADSARFAYNWALEQEQTNYKSGGKFLSHYDLRKEFTQFKKNPDIAWLSDVSNNVTKQAIKDACEAYQRFFKGLNGYPNFKSKRKSHPSFYQDTDKIEFTGTHVKLEKIADSTRKNRRVKNWVRLAEKNRIPIGCKYSNPRITFDGINWWISVGVEENQAVLKPTKSCGVGIDLGIKDLAICSDGTTYKNINKSSKVEKLEKRLKRQKRKQSRMIENNIDHYITDVKGYKHPVWKRPLDECKNFIKQKGEVQRAYKRLSNIRHNYLHQITAEIISREPKFICIEDLNVKGMTKNKHLSKAVQEQGFHEFRRQIEYKANWHNIPVIVADKWYPSSKTCCCCGHIKKDLKLFDRTYICPKCGNKIDRDYQASINLERYGETEYQQIYESVS